MFLLGTIILITHIKITVFLITIAIFYTIILYSLNFRSFIFKRLWKYVYASLAAVKHKIFFLIEYS